MSTNTKIIPPFKGWVLENFPFIEADFDAVTNYQLICKVIEYLNKVIDSENEQNIAIEDLYNKFIQLKNYVDNLDLQDEVNNKLDEMAESGQLADIIAQYLELAGMITFNTVAEMKLAENLVNGSKCCVLGYRDANDGGYAIYKVRTITNDDVVDEGSIVELYDNSLIAELISSDSITIKQFGAYGDNIHDDTSYFINALNYMNNSNIKKMIVNIGKYYINDTLNIPTNVVIEGINQDCYSGIIDSKKGSIIVRKSNKIIFNIAGNENFSIADAGVSNIQIKNLTFYTDTENYCTNPIVKMFRAIYNRFENLHFGGKGKAIFFDKAVFDSRFLNCDFTGNNDIEFVEAIGDEYHDASWYGVNQIYFINCRWEGFTNDKIIYLKDHTHDITFLNCKWEGNILNGGSLIVGEGINGNITFDNCYATIYSTSISSLINFNNLSHGKINFYIQDNRTAELTNSLPYLIFNNGTGLNINIDAFMNINSYLCEYYIENNNTLQINTLTGSLFQSSYYLPNRIRIYKNTELQNKGKTIFSSTNTTSSNVGSMFIRMNKSEDKTQEKTWVIHPSYSNYTNDVTQISVTSPDGNQVMKLENSRLSVPKKLTIPYLTEAPSYFANGDILINKYTDSSLPVVNITIENSSKRIGFSDAPPSSGLWLKGNIIFNSNPTAGGNVGWICTAQGTPGTWKAFGSIEN